jgi:prepilin-type processing-associated H-X9-DG protein
LIVVLAIIGVLCAILFPVFAAAKGAANRAVCISNLRNLGSGARLYATDYDDRFMPVNHNPTPSASSRTDRTWVQLTLPYVRNFAIFHCPADNSDRPRPEATYDQDLVPGDTDSQYYTASLRSNYGYNYQNLTPIQEEFGAYSSHPKTYSLVDTPSSTILFVDSVWSRDDNGRPNGGGNWLVAPPCRYYTTRIDSFTGLRNAKVLSFSSVKGWNINQEASADVYGNAWPWHGPRMNVAFVDGSVRSMTPRDLSAGCDVREAWAGAIEDPSTYLWDVR